MIGYLVAVTAAASAAVWYLVGRDQPAEVRLEDMPGHPERIGDPAERVCQWLDARVELEAVMARKARWPR